MLRRVAQPRFVGLRDVQPQLPRRGALPPFRQRDGGERAQPVRRARLLGRALKPVRGGFVVLQVPVIHEPEILHELPFVRLRREPFLQQRDREIGAPGAARRRLAEKDRAEPVRDAEVRIERRRQIQQRVEERVRAHVRRRRQPLAPEVLQRADPVDVRDDAFVGERQPPHRRGRAHVQHRLDVGRRRRQPGIRGRVHDDGAGETQDRAGRSGSARHLKSRRAKSAAAPKTSAAIYKSAYPAVAAT